MKLLRRLLHRRPRYAPGGVIFTPGSGHAPVIVQPGREPIISDRDLAHIAQRALVRDRLGRGR